MGYTLKYRLGVDYRYGDLGLSSAQGGDLETLPNADALLLRVQDVDRARSARA